MIDYIQDGMDRVAVSNSDIYNYMQDGNIEAAIQHLMLLTSCDHDVAQETLNRLYRKTTEMTNAERFEKAVRYALDDNDDCPLGVATVVKIHDFMVESDGNALSDFMTACETYAPNIRVGEIRRLFNGMGWE